MPTPKRDDETMEGYLIRLIQDEALTKAAEIASANLPDNEPGDYAQGRRDARDAILALISR